MTSFTSPSNDKSPSRGERLTAKPSGTAIARRGARFAAAAIDWLTILAPSAPVAIVLASLGLPVVVTSLLCFAVGAVVFCAINFRMLDFHGQTIGKRIMRLRIVGLDGSIPPAKVILIKRYVPVWFAAAVPYAGIWLVVVDAIFIFREESECVHDIFSGMQVVNSDMTD